MVWTSSLASRSCFPIRKVETAAQAAEGRDGLREAGAGVQKVTPPPAGTLVVASICLVVEASSFSDGFVFLVGLPVQKVVSICSSDPEKAP